MAPVIMGNPDRPELGDGADEQLLPHRSGDRRRILRGSHFSPTTEKISHAVRTPALILQCAEDVIAPDAVGDYVHRTCRASQLV